MYFVNLILKAKDKKNLILGITQEVSNLQTPLVTHAPYAPYALLQSGILTQVLCCKSFLLYSIDLSYWKQVSMERGLRN